MMSDKFQIEHDQVDPNSSLSPHHSKFSEAALEQAIIELLGREGYPPVNRDEVYKEIVRAGGEL